MNTADFSDMDDFDSARVSRKPKPELQVKADKPTIPCPACGGSGTYRGVVIHRDTNECFTCKGTGRVREDHAKRKAAAKKAKATREANLARKKEEFKAAQPEAYAWMHEEREFAFR